MVVFPYTFGDYDRNQIGEIEEKLENIAIELNKNSKAVNIFLFTQFGLR